MPLSKENFKTLSLMQFYTYWDDPTRTEAETLKIINALNQKIPIGKLSLNSENSLEYHYYLPVSSSIPLTLQEFTERISLVLSQLEVIYSIWPLDIPTNILMEKIMKM